MNENARAQIRTICRKFGFGPLEFETNGTVTIHSKEPILDRLRAGFPLCEIIDYGQLPIDECPDSYWVNFIPESQTSVMDEPGAELLELRAGMPKSPKRSRKL